MNRDTCSPNRREFIAGAIGVGGAVLGVDAATGKRWAKQPVTGEASGQVEVVVRFEPAAGAGKNTLQRHARETQRPFEQFAAEQQGVRIERSFWAVNAALVSVDLGNVSRSTVLGVDGVTGVHPNYAVDGHSTVDETTAVTTDANTSQAEDRDVAYHLEEMNVPQAWEAYETRGEGVDVAVIDTGIDTTGHEELAASLERGGWAEFDERGNRVDSEPNAQTNYPSAGHGTAVSGAIAGGATDDGTRYGVAPGVNLYKAKLASQPPEGIRTLSVFAGIEWAIEQDVDIVSMSLGLPMYSEAFVEPVRNAIESGLLLVAGMGNSGRQTGFSPANIPGVLSVGGIDDDREMYTNSSGERIDTERYWGDTAVDSWPQEYTVPDVTAPGVDTLGPVLDGQFDRGTGTSFATPCVAGVAALAMAATDADPDVVRQTIIETARHPAATDDFDVDPGHDDRYGQGIVSALTSIGRLKATETVSGTVTDASGEPLDGVTVASEVGITTETDTQGRYELTLPPGTQPIGATGLGFETAVVRFDPADTDSRGFDLERTGDLGVEMADRLSRRVDPGETATATFDVANAEAVVVEAETDGLFGPEQLELSVDGTPAAFGDPVALDAARGQLTVGVSLPESTPIGQFQLAFEFTDGEESVTGESHVVYAHPDPYVVSPTEPPTLQGPIDLVAPRTTIELTDGQGDAVASSGDSAGIVVDKPLTLTAADGAAPTVQFSNEGAENPAVVLVDANDVTISGLVVDGTGAETGIQVARVGAIARGLPQPSGVTVRDLSVSGAATAVFAGQAPALRIVDNELTATTTGVSVGRQLKAQETTTVTSRAKTLVRANTITDVETGINAPGQVAAIDGNTLSNVGGAGIQVGTPRFLSLHWGQEVGPIQSNTVTGASRGIVVSGVLTLPVEANTLSDITETALVVDGAVLAPIRANSVDGAQTGLTVADGAEVATLADNEFANIQQPGDEQELGETDEQTPSGQDTDETTPKENTESTAEPRDETATATDDGEPTAEPESDTETAESDSDGSGPGFGVGTTLAGLGGVGYLLRRRLSGDRPESE